MGCTYKSSKWSEIDSKLHVVYKSCLVLLNKEKNKKNIIQ